MDVVGIIITILFMLLAASMAHRKGYNVILWMLGGSLLGCIVLAFLPSLSDPDLSEEMRRDRKTTGDILAVVMFVVSILIGVGLLR